MINYVDAAVAPLRNTGDIRLYATLPTSTACARLAS